MLKSQFTNAIQTNTNDMFNNENFNEELIEISNIKKFYKLNNIAFSSIELEMVNNV